MSELPSWLPVVLAVPGTIVAIIQLCRFVPRRRHRRMLRMRCWKMGPFEYRRLDMTDDDQL